VRQQQVRRRPARAAGAELVVEEPPPAPLRRVAERAIRVLRDIDEVLAKA
jgi:hypothetical protein